jgi:hypothetical protein
MERYFTPASNTDRCQSVLAVTGPPPRREEAEVKKNLQSHVGHGT